jgi:cystatin-A/B
MEANVDTRCGGFGGSKTPDDAQVAILTGLKSQVETSLGKECATFEAVAVVSQVVAGMNHKFKVKTGENEFIHVEVFVPLPHTKSPPSLSSVNVSTADAAL